MLGLFTKPAIIKTNEFFQINHVQEFNFRQYFALLTEMNTFFSVSVCGVNRKEFTSVPMKVVDINLHFDEQLLMNHQIWYFFTCFVTAFLGAGNPFITP